MGRKADADRLFAMTREGTGPETVVRLAEAFGMMLVRVEAREFQSSQLIQQLQSKNAELEALHRVLVERNEDLQKTVDGMYAPGSGLVGQSEVMRESITLIMIKVLRSCR